MIHRTTRSLMPRPLALVSLIAVALGACAQEPVKLSRTQPVPEASLSAYGGAGHIVLDGDISEWAYTDIAHADARHIYVRFSLGPARNALQAGDETVLILLDVDGSTLTGNTGETWPGAAGMGVDLEIQISPMDAQRASPRRGVALAMVDRKGRRSPISHADAGFIFAPTIASEWYEMRVNRNLPGLGGFVDEDPSLAIAPVRDQRPTPPTRARATTSGAGVVVLVDAKGRQNGSLSPFTFRLPELATGPAPANATLPPRRADTVRIMSYNVLRSSPAQTPGPFARLITAIDPDVVLLQEWDADVASIASWFERNVGSRWNVIAHPDQGVAIAARGSVTPLLDGPIEVRDGERPVRAILGLVRTPLRDTVVASVHLKCCGGAGTEEDLTRLAEAKAINEAFARRTPAGDKLRVIGGDLNLVGSAPPLDALRLGIDTDRSELSVAKPLVLGDGLVATWRDPTGPFTPGRLDYILFSDAQAEIVRAFVVDTQNLSERDLAVYGLEASDSLASDHLPVVVDLKPRVLEEEALEWPLAR